MGQGARSCRTRARGGSVCASPRGTGPVDLSAPILPRVRASGEVRSAPVGGRPLANRVVDGCLLVNGLLRLRGARGLPTDWREGRKVVVLPQSPLKGQTADDATRSLPVTCAAGDRESTHRRLPDRCHVGSHGGRARLCLHLDPKCVIAVADVVATGESARSAIHVGERMLRRRRRTPVGARGARR